MTAERSVWRFRLLSACFLLAALCLHQAPGLIVPDTKLDLTANPASFLSRALTVWDGSSLGQLQNQAYGYLFPVGPFHWFLDVLGLPEWLIQRLWWALILCVAFLGLWRLGTVLGIGTPWTRYFAALVFALSPRFLSEVAITSVEVWPMALAPWVLVPLVDPAPRPLLGRVARSAAAFGLIGGVNAVATGVALVLPTLWLLTQPGRWSRVRTFVLWLGACLMAAAWWLVPLLVLGRYSPPFLDWIEDARVTTGTSSAVAAIQGTTAWLSYLTINGQASWPTGWLFASQPVLIAVSFAIAILGLAGLARRDMPARGWLLTALAVGSLALTLGFSRSAPGPFVDQVHALLDGPLAPLRNLHKFELVLRIPLVLGLAHASARLVELADSWGISSIVQAVAAAVPIVVIAAPGLVSALPRAGAYETIPAHWRDVARWLDAQPAPGSALVVPAASFADLTWGSPKDEPLQALMKRPLVVRDAVPLGSAGATRLLDEVERRLRNGTGSPELRQGLAQAGIRYVVVRNDLVASVATAQPVAVHESLDEAGIKRVAAFGPPAGSQWESSELTVSERTLLPYPSVEVFDVGSASAVRYVPVSKVTTLIGGPEDVFSLTPALSRSSALVLREDGEAAGLTPVNEVLTDGLRRREVAFGRPSNNTSETLAADAEARSRRKTIDYLPTGARPSAVLEWQGVAAVDASSSASDATATLPLGPGHWPGAALDGDPTTRWVSGEVGRGVGAWLDVQFLEPRDVRGTTIVLSGQSTVEAIPTRVMVSTDAGRIEQEVRAGGEWRLEVPEGRTARLRITLTAVSGAADGAFSIAELDVPGVQPEPRIVTTTAARGALNLIAFRVQDGGSSGCHFAGSRPLCAASSVVAGEEVAGIRRGFTTGDRGQYRFAGEVVPRPSASLDALLDLPGRATATASSRAVPGPAGRPAAVLDRDVGTGWVAGSEDVAPTLRVTLPGARRLTGLQVLVDPALAASRPSQVMVTLGDRRRISLPVDREGYVRFPATRTASVTITFTGSQPTTNVDARTGWRSVLPVGISELRLIGAEDLRTPLDPGAFVGSECGLGPDLRVDGTRYETQVRGTVEDVLRGSPLSWEVCGAGASTPVSLSAGRHVLIATASAEFLPSSVLLRKRAVQEGEHGQAAPATPPVRVVVESDRARKISVGAREETGLIVMPHNFNDAWVATTPEGTELQAVRVNGWQQAWVIPAGPATMIGREFVAQRPYALGLVVGAELLLLILFAAVRRWSRDDVIPVSSSGGGRLAAAVVVVAALLNAGWVGCVAVLAAVGIHLVSRHLRPVAGPAIVTAGFILAVAVMLDPWGAGGAQLTSAFAQFVAWLLLVVVGTSAVTGGEIGPVGTSPRDA